MAGPFRRLGTKFAGAFNYEGGSLNQSQSARLINIIRETALSARTDDLLPRVKGAISEHEMASEVLVKLIQIFVATIWLVLYAVSRKTDAGTLFSPVPYALAAYFLLNAGGLYFALRRPLPAWSIYLSCALDVCFLMLLMWTFHVQYGQPAAFYLKVPTLLYVFIFIALRALRFEPRFVLATGGFAAMGWLVLVLYAIFEGREGDLLTRDYIHYMTSNSILIGAEFDKIISILLVSGIIALALKRANGFLVRATSESISVRDLSRFFDQSVADRIKDAEHPLVAGESARRQAAILFVDIRSFTPMSAKLDAEAVVTMLTAYQARIVPIIQNHGGVIDKFLGDGIMATFGAVNNSSTSAADSLRALDAIIAETDTWGKHSGCLADLPRGSVNGAAAVGQVVFGVVGNDKRLEYTVIGDPVNLAAKLEKLNRTLQSRAVASAATLRAGMAQGYMPRSSLRRVNTNYGEAVVLSEAIRSVANSADDTQAQAM